MGMPYTSLHPDKNLIGELAKLLWNTYLPVLGDLKRLWKYAT